MDGENNGSKPYEQMDDLDWFGGFSQYFWVDTQMYTKSRISNTFKHQVHILFGCPSRTPCCESRQDKEQNLQTSKVNGVNGQH